MVRTGGVLLLVNGVWNLLVWPPFLRRMARDPRARDDQGRATRFLRVHLAITGTAAALAVLSLLLGLRLVAPLPGDSGGSGRARRTGIAGPARKRRG